MKDDDKNPRAGGDDPPGPGRRARGGGRGGGPDTPTPGPAPEPRHEPDEVQLVEPVSVRIESLPPLPGSPGMGPSEVRLQRAGVVNPNEIALWAAIQQHSVSISFNAFEAWMNR